MLQTMLKLLTSVETTVSDQNLLELILSKMNNSDKVGAGEAI